MRSQHGEERSDRHALCGVRGHGVALCRARVCLLRFQPHFAGEPRKQYAAQQTCVAVPLRLLSLTTSRVAFPHTHTPLFLLP
jgi:hypothetical protein